MISGKRLLRALAEPRSGKASAALLPSLASALFSTATWSNSAPAPAECRFSSSPRSPHGHGDLGRGCASSARPIHAPGDSGSASSPAQGQGQKLIEAESATSGGEHRHPRQFRSGPVTWGSLALLLATGGGLLWYFEKEKQRRLQALRSVRSVGKASIGGPFSLLNDEGKAVTEATYKGQWNLVYFGFTFCPDICPAELEKMAEAINLLEKRHGAQVRPIFVSVDPDRDTPEQVHAYVKEFHPRLVGLTGTPEAVKAAAREYRVYYMKTEEEGDDYLVDHSIIMYLMDPNMEFVKFFGRNTTADSLADGVAHEIKQWKVEST